MFGLIRRIRLIDEQMLAAMLEHRRPRLDRFMRVVTHLSHPLSAILFVGLMMWSRQPAVANAGRQAAFALIASHAFVQLFKRGIARPRPHLPVDRTALVEAPDVFSFPSGHAAAALSIALPLAEISPGMLGPMVLGLAALVGFSRCYLGIHYPCDVLAGWVLAIAAHVFDITALP